MAKSKKSPTAEDMVQASGEYWNASSYRRTAGLRLTGFGTQASLQKFRGNYDLLGISKQFSLARWLSHYNWFVAPVLEIKRSVIMDGFCFEGQEARDWVRIDRSRRKQSPQALYPWARLVRDVVDEMLCCENVILLWRKGQEFPVVDVLDCEAVNYRCVGGQECITLKYKAIRKADRPDQSSQALLSQKYGLKWLETFMNGGTKTIVQGEDPDFEFIASSRGKRREELRPPSVMSIADDLDFIEMVKVGDWNGAYARKRILLHAKKGTEPRSSDPMAAKSGKATYPELKAIKAKLEDITGHADIVTNFDVNLAWESFSADFFGREGSITYDSRQRIMGWGGWAALLMHQGFSQVRGNRGDITSMARSEVAGIRDQVKEVVGDLFNHANFKIPDENAPWLGITFSDRLLYTTEELVVMVRALSSTGLSSFRTVRQCYLGLDPDLESKLLKEEGQDREGFTPPFEPKQGLLNLDDDDSGGEGAGRPPVGESEHVPGDE